MTLAARADIPLREKLPWPSGPFPAPRRLRLLLAAAWILSVVMGGVAIGLGALFVHLPSGRQLLVDTALTLRLGEPIPGARIERAGSCSHYRTTGRPAWSGYRCDFLVTGPGLRHRIETDLSEPVTASRIGEPGRVLGQVGAAWPAGLLARRWVQLLPFPVTMAFVCVVAAAGARQARSLTRVRRLLRRGRLQGVDLLRRREIGRARQGPRIVWDFAYDHEGRRRHAADELPQPLLLDAVVTRAAALVGPDGDAILVEPGFVDPALVALIEERRVVSRWVTPALDALAASSPPGPRRAFVEAYRDLWAWGGPVEAAAALARRNAAGAILDPAAIDDLLARCRAALGEQGRVPG